MVLSIEIKTVSAIDLKMINDFASRNMFVIATGRNENTFSFFSQHYDLAYQLCYFM